MSLNTIPPYLSKHEYSRLTSAIDASQHDLFHSVLLKSIKVLNDGLRTTPVAPGQTLFDLKLDALYNALKRLQAEPALYPNEPERFRNTAVTLFVFYRVLYKGVHEAFCNQKAISGAFLEDPYILFKHCPYKIYEILGSQFWRIYEFHHLITGDLTQLKLNADILPFLQAGIGDTENQPNSAPVQIFPNPSATLCTPIAPCSSAVISFTEQCTPCAAKVNPTPQPSAPLAPPSSSIISFCTPCAPSNVSQNTSQTTLHEDPLITEFRTWVQQQFDQGHLKLNEKGMYSLRRKFGADVFVDLKTINDFTSRYQKNADQLKTALFNVFRKTYEIIIDQKKVEVYRLTNLNITAQEFNPQEIEEQI